jgi:hypothetical protein
MKVIFLDFDGVLNSSASFLMESRKKKRLVANYYKGVKPGMSNKSAKEYRVNQTFSEVAASNFQYILDKCPDVKVVISSTWRLIHTIEFLMEKLEEYGIDSSRVIGKTPRASSGRLSQDAPRGDDISEWLAEHPEVTDYVILDDNSDMTVHMDKLVQTTWLDGLTLSMASTVIAKLGGDATGRGLPL